MNWQPSATIPQLKIRAQMLARIRSFFTERGFLEVDTPILSSVGITDVYIDQLSTQCMSKTYYLQTSPEYPMKRLLAAGSGSIFQLARVFRDNEKGRWHNPEFLMLEWYQLDVDHHGLMAQMNTFLQYMLDCEPMVKRTYQEVFETFVGINPHKATLEQLREAAKRYQLDNVFGESEEDKDAYLFLFMSHIVEPALAKDIHPTAVYGFPPSQAALARVEHNIASRFEVYYKGIELANGFFELQDNYEQTKRFEEDNRNRLQRGLPSMEMDNYFLAALTAGLPICSGVALGVDRLIAIASNKDQLSETMAFDFMRV